MKIEVIRPDIVEKYVGKKFRYNSKYGWYTDNILCKDVSVCEIINVKSGEPYVESIEVSIISDKRNVYDLKDVEFYEEVN